MSVTWRLEEDRAAARLAAGLVSYVLGVPTEDIVAAKTRGCAEAAFARQVAMYLAHVAFGLSLARVAAAFCRDRSTVSHACAMVEQRRDEAPVDAMLTTLEAAAREAPSARTALRRGLT